MKHLDFYFVKIRTKIMSRMVSYSGKKILICWQCGETTGRISRRQILWCFGYWAKIIARRFYLKRKNKRLCFKIVQKQCWGKTETFFNIFQVGGKNNYLEVKKGRGGSRKFEISMCRRVLQELRKYQVIRWLWKQKNWQLYLFLLSFCSANI